MSEPLERQLSQTPKDASPFGLKVARILDDIWALYNIATFTKIDFSAEDAVQFRLHKSIATYDFDELTQLVVRCHDACVRLSIRGSGSHLSLHFSPRERDTESMVTSHPTMEQAIERVRTRNYFRRNGAEKPPAVNAGATPSAEGAPASAHESSSPLVKCCERDTNADGNCDRHEAPGILRFLLGDPCP